MKMKWHKFLVYFLLWFYAICYFTEGILSITGAMHFAEGGAAAVYEKFPGIKTVDLYFSVMSFALALISVSVRSKLKAFRCGAVMNWYSLIALGLMADVIYIILSAYMRNESAPWLTVIIVSIINIAYFLLNYLYFKKRESMFDK